MVTHLRETFLPDLCRAISVINKLMASAHFLFLSTRANLVSVRAHDEYRGMGGTSLRVENNILDLVIESVN